MNILWDFDGTLFNTYPMYAKIFKSVLGGEKEEREIFQHLKISFSHAAAFYNLSKEQIMEINKTEDNLAPADVPPFPGVEDILRSAKKNVMMTHKTSKGVLDILDYYQFKPYFEEIITIENGSPRKTSPESYVYLHNRHQLDLVVGDRLLDILPGKSIGIKTCLFQNKEEGADYYLEDYSSFFNEVVL